MSTSSKAGDLLRLHQDPALLTVVNVWDVISAKVVADDAGHAGAGHGQPLDRRHASATPTASRSRSTRCCEMCGRIAAAVDLPVTADLEGGYGDAPDTIRRAIGLGIVGANIEDQMKPVTEAARQVEQIMAVAAEEGVPDFVLNARTDAFVKAGDRDQAEVLADAVERGRAYLDAGAPVVFVPARLDEQQVTTLVDAFGPQRLTLIGVPGSLPLAGSRSSASPGSPTGRIRSGSP